MNTQRRLVIATAALCLSFSAALAGISHAAAQDWPTRPVKLIVSLGPGSGVDITARLVADRLAARWMQSVVVENRPGGDAVVAINAFISARDSHTLLFTPTSSFVAHPYQHEKLPYDPDELSPLARITSTFLGFAVNPSLNVATLADFIALIRAQPGKLNYSTGTGVTDVQYDAYFKRENLAIARVSYRDVVTPMTDLGEGRIQAYVAGLPIIQPHALAGRAKLVAVTNSQRAASLPDLPTVAQAGFLALTFDGLIGVFGPRDMPETARQRFAADIRAVLIEPAVASRLTAMGTAVVPGNAAEFAASLQEQRSRLAAALGK